jgi:sporulation protein YlmC with PRC-barrel domain
MNRSLLAGSAAACICLSLGAPLRAAEPAASGTANPPVPAETAAATQPAQQCLTDLGSFDSQMQKDGYWLGETGYGYGYPMTGVYGLGYPRSGGITTTATGYQDARPGYDVRTLVVAANILARSGQQQPCEDVLAAARASYKLYVADMHGRKLPMADVPGWRQQQITAARPVTAGNTSFRSDQLIGIDVLNPQNEVLGSVNDLVTSPQTGKIAYLVIARGGVFGIDEKYVPTPWEDFKITPNSTLLVLDTTKSALEAAPQVSDHQFATPGLFDQESQTVNAYWKTHLSNNGTNKTNG